MSWREKNTRAFICTKRKKILKISPCLPQQPLSSTPKLLISGRNTTDSLQKWIEADPDRHIYIGRPGVVFVDGKRFPPASHTSSRLFGNPFKIGKDGLRAKVLASYRRYALERMKTDAEYRDAVLNLKGKILGCWCAPEGCHGDILKEIAETMKKEDFCEEVKKESGKIRSRDE
jgi:hypothetical protein